MTPDESQAVARRENQAGLQAARAGHPGIAAAHFARAVAAFPHIAAFHANLGKALMNSGNASAAVEPFRRAIALNPNLPEFHNHLSHALDLAGDNDAAIAAIMPAIHLRPNVATYHGNLGILLHDQGRYDEAIAELNRSIELDPNYAWSHFTLGVIHLLRGDMERGWPELDWRRQCDDGLNRNFPVPFWQGEPLDGKTILLHAEQGLGDTLQFVRYVSLVRERGGRVILECQPELIQLLEGYDGVEQVIARNQPLPHFDLHCPLLRLPLVFRTTLENLPANIPYIKPPHPQPASNQTDCIHVGLCWAGQPAHRNDRNRSLRLAQLAPLAAVQGVQFFSLQKGPAADQAKNPPSGMKFTNWFDEMTDMAQTANLMAGLDLIITVDTAIAHLAGAMGKPTAVLLPYVPDWRWMLGRKDTPWYPTFYLFRQEDRGKWDEVIQQVHGWLQKIREAGARRNTGLHNEAAQP